MNICFRFSSVRPVLTGNVVDLKSVLSISVSNNFLTANLLQLEGT